MYALIGCVQQVRTSMCLLNHLMQSFDMAFLPRLACGCGEDFDGKMAVEGSAVGKNHTAQKSLSNMHALNYNN